MHQDKMTFTSPLKNRVSGGMPLLDMYLHSCKIWLTLLSLSHVGAIGRSKDHGGGGVGSNPRFYLNFWKNGGGGVRNS